MTMLYLFESSILNNFGISPCFSVFHYDVLRPIDNFFQAGVSSESWSWPLSFTLVIVNPFTRTLKFSLIRLVLPMFTLLSARLPCLKIFVSWLIEKLKRASQCIRKLQYSSILRVENTRRLETKPSTCTNPSWTFSDWQIVADV